jgi:hypothetical protein
MAPWPALIGRLRFLMDFDGAQFAGHFGVDEPTVDGWEQGIMMPERHTQKIIRDKLHDLEPALANVRCRPSGNIPRLPFGRSSNN